MNILNPCVEMSREALMKRKDGTRKLQSSLNILKGNILIGTDKSSQRAQMNNILIKYSILETHTFDL